MKSIQMSFETSYLHTIAVTHVETKAGQFTASAQHKRTEKITVMLLTNEPLFSKNSNNKTAKVKKQT